MKPVELTQDEAEAILRMIADVAEPTGEMRSLADKLCETFDIGKNPAEHRHKWASCVGDKWEQCIAQQVHGEPYCGFFRNAVTTVIRKFDRVSCPKGCGLTYYPFEARDHNCWDS